MMSMETIREMSRDAAAAAAKEGLVPFMVEKEDLEDWRAMAEMGRQPSMPFPNIGDMDPAGWESVEDGELFVDSSGMGGAGEMAMTAAQMLDALEAGYGYAITQVGQFQVYVGKFRKVA